MSEAVYCTIIAKNRLAHARVLATTLAAHNPQSRLFVLLADKVDGYFDPSKEPFRIVFLEDLADQEKIDKMCFYYNLSEFCWALQAWLHEYMLKRTTVSKWVFLDSDIMVCHDLQSISGQLDKTSILLSPHLLSIYPPPSVNVKSVRKLESYHLHTGMYNGGFLGLRRTDESAAFIYWYKDHLRFYAFDDRPSQVGNQIWLTFVPLYFRDFSVLRDPGANLAYWNLYERTIEKDNMGVTRINGEPLLFFHFAGFDAAKPDRLTNYGMPRGLGVFPDSIRKLGDSYRQLLLDNGYEEVSSFPYAFEEFETGQAITPLMRRLYFAEVFNGQVGMEGSPFEQYTYFRSRLRLQGVKNFFWNAGRYFIKQMRRWLNPNYHFEIR